MPAGYSGTPLPKKLGLTERSRLLVVNEPPEYLELVGPLPQGLRKDTHLTKTTTVVHVFVESRAELVRRLTTLRNAIQPEAAVWVSWPKKSSGVATDISENTIRDVALPLGFVDVKVCAVSDIWSGLKLVVRKTLR